jgi:hypothetical protein
MLPALAADTARHICRVRAVLQVITAASCQSGRQLLGPFPVGPGQSPHLVGGQAEIPEYRPERLARIDRI